MNIFINVKNVRKCTRSTYVVVVDDDDDAEIPAKSCSKSMLFDVV